MMNYNSLLVSVMLFASLFCGSQALLVPVNVYIPRQSLAQRDDSASKPNVAALQMKRTSQTIRTSSSSYTAVDWKEFLGQIVRLFTNIATFQFLVPRSRRRRHSTCHSSHQTSRGARRGRTVVQDDVGSSDDASDNDDNMRLVEVDPSVRAWVDRVKEGRLTIDEKHAFLADTLSGRHTWSSLRNKPPIAAIAPSGVPITIVTRNPSTEEPWLEKPAAVDNLSAVATNALLLEQEQPVLDINSELLSRQTRAYREQRRVRMDEIASQKLLSSVATIMAQPRQSTLDTAIQDTTVAVLERTRPFTVGQRRRLDGSMDNSSSAVATSTAISASTVLPEYAIIDESRTVENYWRSKVLRQAPTSYSTGTTSSTSALPSKPNVKAPSMSLDNSANSQRRLVTAAVEDSPPKAQSNATPPTFSYLKSFMTDRPINEPIQAKTPPTSKTARYDVKDVKNVAVEPRPLPFLNNLPHRAEEDSASRPRQGPIRMPIPLETNDPSLRQRSVEDDRRARQSIRDAMTRSLTSTVSQNSRSKKWGIDMDKL